MELPTPRYSRRSEGRDSTYVSTNGHIDRLIARLISPPGWPYAA